MITPISIRPVKGLLGPLGPLKALFISILFLPMAVMAQSGAPTADSNDSYFAQGTTTSTSGSASPTIGSINGTILEADTGAALFAATVSIYSAEDSTLVTGEISNEEGQFRIKRIDSGTYFGVVSFVGFAAYETDLIVITQEQRQIDLGTIRLNLDAELMEGVEIVAERAEVSFEIDRTVYNTKNQLSSAGGSATDVLQNIPSIEVDVDGKVSLRGNQGVAILINGKSSPLTGDFLATFLQQIPASSIDRVEVIPNPSAKYDPDGQAGAINIVLKKEVELGTSGGITSGAGTDGGYNVSGSYNVQRGALKLFTNYGYRNEDRDSNGFNFRENRYVNPLTFLEQDNVGLRTSQSHLFNTSADYTLSDISELSASALVSFRNGDNLSTNDYFNLGTERVLTDRSSRRSIQSSDGNSMDYSLSFRRIPEASKRELTGEVRFNRSNGASADDLSEQLLSLDGGSALNLIEATINELDNIENEWTAQLDAIRTFGEFKAEAGFKGDFRRMDNSFDVSFFEESTDGFVDDITQSNTFDYIEDVTAGYGILSTGFGKFEMQAGVRAELARTEFALRTTDETFDNDYFSLFPSAFLNYNLSQTKQLKVSYSKRVTRPRTSQLNPFTTYTDPLNLNVGNPLLEPQYIHAFELGYQTFSRKGSLSVTPYYRRTVNQIERYKTVDNTTGISTLTYRNFDKSESYGAELIGSLRIGSKLSGFSSFNAYKIVTDGGNVESDLSNDAVSWSSRASASYKINSQIDLQLFYFYRAPIDVAQGRISSFSVSNISLRHKVLQDRGSVTIKFNDPLDRMGFEFEIDQDAFYQLGNRKWESRSANITFQYNFGKPPKRTQRRNQDQGGAGFDEVGIG